MRHSFSNTFGNAKTTRDSRASIGSSAQPVVTPSMSKSRSLFRLHRRTVSTQLPETPPEEVSSPPHKDKSGEGAQTPTKHRHRHQDPQEV